ncbi:MAG: Rieske 2Fe-2S domain-containing protein [Acidimicrobiales bacterium]
MSGQGPSRGATGANEGVDADRAERHIALAFAIAALAAVGLGVTYWRGGQAQLEGLLLAVTLGGIGVGIVIWAKAFMPDDEVTEERHPIGSEEEDVAAFTTDFEAGTTGLRRRGLLTGLAGTAFAALAGALLFPIRSLGPRPGRDLKMTPYAGSVKRVVTEDGNPIRPEDLPVDGVLTVWPEGHTHAADAPTLLIHTRPGQELRLQGEKVGWVVGGIVAYSKLCTHTGCPVGLYQADEALLLCPCHQSTFDVLDGAEPIFGPAARPLPQLPLDVDDEGYLVATGDFEAPVGPGFWDRGR